MHFALAALCLVLHRSPAITWDNSPLLSGFTWPEAEARIGGEAYAIDEPTGRGHLILIAEDPNFPNFWRGLEKLFTNALLLAPALDGTKFTTKARRAVSERSART